MRSSKTQFGFVLASALLIAQLVTAEEVVVAAFSSASAGSDFPSGWRVAKLPGGNATRFRMVDTDGDTVVQMDAANAAATLYRPVRTWFGDIGFFEALFAPKPDPWPRWKANVPGSD